jgi:type VI protein secretion system component VasK
MRAGSELEAELNDAVTAASSLDKGLGSARARGKQRGASRDFDLLKTYLMVTSPRRLEIDFAANVLVEQWKKRLHPEVSSNSALLESIAVRYLAAIKDYRATLARARQRARSQSAPSAAQPPRALLPHHGLRYTKTLRRLSFARRAR